jgi:flavodoxin
MSAKIQVIFYSMYGHIYQLAEAVTAGTREAGAERVKNRASAGRPALQARREVPLRLSDRPCRALR